MNDSDSRFRFIEETRRALERHASERAAVDGDGAESPAPGDVYVLDRTAEFDVEWAIIDRDPVNAERLLTVPADGCSLVGSADVEVSEVAPFGPLVLRCRFGSWIDAECFDPGIRVGVLGPDDVARARLKLSEVEQRSLDDPGSTLDADLDPDYRDWVEGVLVPARLALAGPFV
jgi:hypothetical protein